MTNSYSSAILNYKRKTSKKIERFLNNEFEKVDGRIELYIEGKDKLYNSILKKKYHDWLSNEERRVLVILGEAGSGKTLSLKEFFLEIALNKNKKHNKIFPIYIDLSNYSLIDDAYELLFTSLADNGLTLKSEDFDNIKKYYKIMIILDSFDEYDKGSMNGISSRNYKNFNIFYENNIYLIIGCRINYFKSISNIKYYSSSGNNLQIIPKDSEIVIIKSLDEETIKNRLNKYNKLSYIPIDILKTPLTFSMFLTIIKNNLFKVEKRFKKWDLYDAYINFLFSWDNKCNKNEFNNKIQEEFYLHFAENVLLTGEASIDYDTMLEIIRTVKCRDINITDDDYGTFFRKSSILMVDSNNKIKFRHKTFREFIVAKNIYTDIQLDNRNFDFIWFTRNERSFISEKLTSDNIKILLSWALDKEHYPAQNYAIFILGLLDVKFYYKEFINIFQENDDLLIRINIVNILSKTKEEWVKDYLICILNGYRLEKQIIKEAFCKRKYYNALDTSKYIKKKFNEHVMEIHISESVEALLNFKYDDEIRNIFKSLSEIDKSLVGDEARKWIDKIEE